MKPSRKQVLDAAARLSEADRRSDFPGQQWAIKAGRGHGRAAQDTVLRDIRTVLDHAIWNDGLEDEPSDAA